MLIGTLAAGDRREESLAVGTFGSPLWWLVYVFGFSATLCRLSVGPRMRSGFLGSDTWRDIELRDIVSTWWWFLVAP